MSKKVILLTNLGSPDSTAVKDVRKYLNEFLMDERVIDLPYLGRMLLVKGIIVPFRAPRSAAKYKTIWTEEGSPLIVITNDLAVKVAHKTGLPVYICMRYANPTPKAAFQRIALEHPDVTEVILVPLYPHYAMSSYETAVEHVLSTHKRGGYGFQLKVVPPYFNDERYIKALAESIRPFLNSDFDHLLFSYHGVPERHIFKADVTGNHCLKTHNCCETASPAHKKCYRHQVKETTRLVANLVGLSEQRYSISFQSRLGTDQWLGPSTANVLAQLPKDGVKKLVVVCPAFVSDCLETLEEIHEEGRETFIKAGGASYTVIPCLNTNDEWVDAIDDLIQTAE
ncbi:ferrochelatase [Alkaliflexus imshenetskii]|uniref:ferrochelatase n=1 Tax=Alkaliflexus imshenetskii TaxID=286730 RepID=UPI00047BB5CD|nr:ferrochelatase [Alkaliflexus imshenetskii]